MIYRRKKSAPGRVAIDLGAYHTRIFSETDGLILDEPSIGLLDMDHPQTGASALSRFGNVAREIFESAPSGKRLVSPLQSDSINNLGYCPKMLSYFINQAKHDGLLAKTPIIVLVTPPGIEARLTEQLRHACFTAGASRVHLADNSIATALGAGLQIEQPHASLLLDFGARDARLYAFANNETIATSLLACGGDLLDQKLADGIREHFGIHISNATATDTKHRVGSAMPANYSHRLRNSCQVQGLAIDENIDTHFSLSTETACTILQPALKQAAASINQAILDLPTYYQNQIKETGVLLTGGGAQLTQIDQLVMEACDLPVEIANRPLSTAARGGGRILESMHGSVEKTTPELSEA